MKVAKIKIINKFGNQNTTAEKLGISRYTVYKNFKNDTWPLGFAVKFLKAKVINFADFVNILSDEDQDIVMAIVRSIDETA